MASGDRPQFTLVITLGNDAMLTLDDVARALEDAARGLRDGNGYHAIRDRNGNVVGGMTGPTRAELVELGE